MFTLSCLSKEQTFSWRMLIHKSMVSVSSEQNILFYCLHSYPLLKVLLTMSDKNPNKHKALRWAERERLAKNQSLNTNTDHQQRHRERAASQRAEDLARETAAATTTATADGESGTEQGMSSRQCSNPM
jgi:hypothetical protein